MVPDAGGEQAKLSQDDPPVEAAVAGVVPDAGGEQARLSQDDPPVEVAVAVAWWLLQTDWQA